MWLFRFQDFTENKGIFCFAKQIHTFIFDVNLQKVRKNCFDPKYKHVSKPGLWLYQNLGAIFYLSMPKPIWIGAFITVFFYKCYFLTESNNWHVLKSLISELFSFVSAFVLRQKQNILTVLPDIFELAEIKKIVFIIIPPIYQNSGIF